MKRYKMQRLNEEKNFPLPKYYRIAEDLRRKIISGEYSPSSRLPGNRDLVVMYNTSTATITNVLRYLDQQNVIEKVQGRGIFVRKAESRKKNERGLRIGYLLDASGDIYSNFYMRLMMRLDKQNGCILQLNHEPLNNCRTPQNEKINVLERIAEDKLDQLVIRGGWHLSFKALYKIRHRFGRINWVFEYDSALDFPGSNIIVPDWTEVGRLGARYLIGEGRKRLVVCLPLMLDCYLRANGSRTLKTNEILHGFKEEMLSAGMNPEKDLRIVKISCPANSSVSDLSEIYAAVESGWDGFLLPFDGMVAPLYRRARKHGWFSEGKISLVSIYNTSWCDVLYPPLSSISLNEEQLADATAELILADKSDQIIKLKPTLIIRKGD